MWVDDPRGGGVKRIEGGPSAEPIWSCCCGCCCGSNDGRRAPTTLRSCTHSPAACARSTLQRTATSSGIIVRARAWCVVGGATALATAVLRCPRKQAPQSLWWGTVALLHGKRCSIDVAVANPGSSLGLLVASTYPLTAAPIWAWFLYVLWCGEWLVMMRRVPGLPVERAVLHAASCLKPWNWVFKVSDQQYRGAQKWWGTRV